MALKTILIFVLSNSNSQLESATVTKWDVREIAGRGEKCSQKLKKGISLHVFCLYRNVRKCEYLFRVFMGNYRKFLDT